MKATIECDLTIEDTKDVNLLVTHESGERGFLISPNWPGYVELRDALRILELTVRVERLEKRNGQR